MPNLRSLPSGLAATAFVGLAIVGLAGCTSSESTADATSAAPTASTTSEASDTPTPTPTGLTGTPLSMDCSTLVQASALDSLYPGFAVASVTSDPTDGPTSGAGPDSERAEVAGVDGTLCDYTDSAGDTISIGVAQLSDASYTAKANDLVASSNSVPTYGVEGYFQVSGGVGYADVFDSPYWIVTESSAYVEPGDAQPIVDQVLASLKTRG